jgi:Zn/Cd-binding protein ZinT
MEETQTKIEKEKENENESANQSLTKTENLTKTSEKEQVKKEAQRRIINPSFALDKIKNRTLDELMNKQIEPFEFMKTEEVSALLDGATVQLVLKKTEENFKRWYNRRGKDVDEVFHEKTKEEFLINNFVRELTMTVCYHFGINGGELINYVSFSESLLKSIRKKPIEKWKEIVQDKIRIWSLKLRVQEEVLKVLALVICKFNTKYFYEGLI